MKKRIDHWQRIIDDVLAVYERLNKSCDAAIAAGAMDINGPLYDAIWRGFSRMLRHIDYDGLVEWFIWENDCGRKRLTAKCAGMKKETAISTPRGLAKLIAKSEAE